uniref:Uveal autoantigen with coiled-coil domains and ankyrin repeats n=1 Tax=Takifugu rubripes TaxID=31033 RepID=A0A674NGS9_TAKRU
MKSLKYRLKKHEVTITNTDWNKYDDRLMKAVERGEVDKVAAVLSKKGVIPTKLDVEGRSAFHLAATRGHLECLNLILGHNVDVTATDASGKNALHLSSRNGHSQCVQKLLQHNCPVGNVDLQGRTALHDAVMAGCSSSVKLLCDGGTAVNASDFDGRTPLVLATQMCHPHICQLLLERGGDITIRDKQNKTALILGCEYGCKDAVEVLLKSGADVKAVDTLGHDAFHYARLSKNPELVGMVKTHLEKMTRGQSKRQNEGLQESLRKYHQEQRALVDKVNLLQQAPAYFILQHYVQIIQKPAVARSMSRPGEKSQPVVGWDISGELNTLRHEHEVAKRRHHAMEEEVARLQAALNRKAQECQEVVRSRDTIQKQADQQIHELEEALGDVQKRMLDSECKVKQLQAHVVAVKEHLGGQGVDELRIQLQDIKAKYEGASAEVGRVRNRLKQSEKALEEYKSSENQLAAEAERLNQDLDLVVAERNELAEVLVEMEAKMKEADTKHGTMVPTEKFDNMKNLLTNAVDEKERQLAELREDYDRVLEEVADLNRKIGSPVSQGEDLSAEEQQRLREILEEQNKSLKQKLVDLTAKSQDLICEVKESNEERNILREQLDEVRTRIQIDFIPIQDYEEARKNMVMALEELEDKLVEASERYGKAEAQVQQLQTERSQLQENISSIKSSSKTHQSQLDQLRSHNSDLLQKIELMQGQSEDGKKERLQLNTQIQTLEKSLAGQHVPKQQHEALKAELSSTLDSVRAEMLKLENEKKESEEELKKVRDGNERLKEELEKVLEEMKKDCIHVKDHNDATDKLNASVLEAEMKVKEVTALYLSAREETVKLTQELQAQKKELDTIQEAIQSKFISVTTAEENQRSYIAQVEELKVKLVEMEAKYNKEKSAGQSNMQEHEKLKGEIESVQQRLDWALVSSNKHKDVEEEFRSKCEELTHKLSNLEQQHQELQQQKAHLQDQNALCKSQNQNLQDRLKSELTRIATYDTELKALHDAMQQAQTDCKKAREAQQQEAQKVCALQKELQESRRDQASLLQQQAQSKEELEAHISKLQLALREEEENNAQRAEDVSALQSELLQATQALETVRYKEDQMSQLQKEKQQLEKEVANLGSKLLCLGEECKEARQESVRARESEGKVRAEMETVQEKGNAIEGEIGELKKRYDESLGTIGDLQRRIQTSAQQTEAKDKKITELLTDVERLKQALSGLSQLAYTSNTPSKRQTQHTEALQAQIKSLQQQLAEAERQHREVVSIYRTHLLSAAQGHMDEDVQAALLQIIRMRRELVC